MTEDGDPESGVDGPPHPVYGFERVVEQIPDPVFVLDRDGRFTYLNPALCAYTGYDRETLLGERFSVLLDDDDAAEGERLVEELLADPERSTARQEIELRSAAGTVLEFETHITLLPPADGSFSGVAAVGRDVSERTERERRLREFTSVVSHDIRNPLNVATGYLDLAADAAEGEVAERIAAAREELDHMESLVENLLTLAREGETIGDPEPVDLGDVAREAWGSISAPEASLSVDVDARVLADAGRLRQLLENLFANAVEHGGESVTVTVGVLDDRGFYVADDGPGVPPDRRQAVFEAGVTTDDDGSGFGLAIVRRIAIAHDWSVAVTEAATGGARFEFTGVRFADRTDRDPAG